MLPEPPTRIYDDVPLCRCGHLMHFDRCSGIKRIRILGADEFAPCTCRAGIPRRDNGVR